MFSVTFLLVKEDRTGQTKYKLGKGKNSLRKVVLNINLNQRFAGCLAKALGSKEINIQYGSLYDSMPTN